ncbi:MAG: aldehyde dehydrogenase family protein [Deltaproteobacteria bacterium]|nr:aldehyde dehydrogenase family protein [Deltaproteobacteria bacterium]MBW1963143.1 aldehyde dehydrogenase family protein [Deltaproteobacteria bacterium]MBW1992884.1 aldehyde dehydrogenase family protein [Deltaproteobacteria bacterium]MBW2154471.1 aldehyde dehydrogenase family protein [Deltaproteobacteria bacterium]
MEDNIQEMYEKARKAFEEVRFWSQQQVDEMVMAVGWEWQKEETRKALARLAVDESGIGVYEDKLNKIKTKTLGTLWDQRGAKTCGLVEEDKARGIRKYAKPMGVIANVVPCTNPESTICCLGLSTLKTRNAMIVSPHPRTQGSSYLTVEYGRKALKKIGAPVDLLQCIKHTSHEKTRQLMSCCDFAVATGGAALVSVVYAAGKPSQTVGAGNVVSIVDETADASAVAHKIMLSKTANNSASCSSENAVAIYEGIYTQMMDCLIKEGGYLCSSQEREQLRKTMWPDGKTLNREIVARNARFIAELAGISVPVNTKFIMVLGEKIGPEDRFSGEKISPVLTVWKWSSFEEMLDRVEKILKFSGEGHSVSLHSERDERRVQLALRANVGRVVCNMPHSYANSGGWGSGLPFTDTLGCGTWAGNITTENVNWRHFLNYTLLAVPIEEYVPTEEELFGPYLAKWGRD